MEILGLNIENTAILGIYIIIHGAIYIAFLFHYSDEKSGAYVGWSGKSWLLNRYFEQIQSRNIGRALWSIVILLFLCSGLSVVDILRLDSSTILLTSSVFGILVYFSCYDGIEPTPLHWILGPVINLILILYVLFFEMNYELLFISLGVVTLYGMFFHTRLIRMDN